MRKIIREILEEIIQGGYDAYHGSDVEINKFVDDFVGGKNAKGKEGAGIYFSTTPKGAEYYGKHIYKVKLSGTFLDKNNSSEEVDPGELVRLIKMKKDWELNAQDYAEDPEVGAMEAAQMAIQYNETEADVWQQIEADFYRDDSVDYVRNMTKLGYDGIIVDAPSDFSGDKHIIVFNPAIIKYEGKVEQKDINEAYIGVNGLQDFDPRLIYPYNDIWNVIGDYFKKNEKYFMKFGWGIFDAIGNKELDSKFKSETNSVFRVEKIDEFNNQEEPTLDYLSSDQEAYEKAREAGFLVNKNGVVLGLNGVNLVKKANA